MNNRHGRGPGPYDADISNPVSTTTPKSLKMNDSFLDGISDLCGAALLFINEAKMKNILDFFKRPDRQDQELVVTWIPDATIMLVNGFAIPLHPDTFIMGVEGTAGEQHVGDWPVYTTLTVEYIPKTKLHVTRSWLEDDVCHKGKLVVSHNLL